MRRRFFFIYIIRRHLSLNLKYFTSLRLKYVSIVIKHLLKKITTISINI